MTNRQIRYVIRDMAIILPTTPPAIGPTLGPLLLLLLLLLSLLETSGVASSLVQNDLAHCLQFNGTVN